MKLHVENLKFRYQIIVLFLILFLFFIYGEWDQFLLSFRKKCYR